MAPPPGGFPPDQPTQPDQSASPYDPKPPSSWQPIPDQPYDQNSNNWNQQPQAGAQQGWGQQAPYDPYAQPPTDPNQYGADYLETIAPGPESTKLFSGNFTWIMIGLAVLFMFAVGLITAMSGTNNAETATKVYMRLDGLITATDKYRLYLKDSDLVAINSSLKIFMTGAKTNLEQPLIQNSVNLGKMPRELKASEKAYIAELEQKFEDAKLNAVLDRVYASAMTYESELMIQQFTSMSRNPSPLIAANAKATLPDLKPIYKALKDWRED